MMDGPTVGAWLLLLNVTFPSGEIHPLTAEYPSFTACYMAAEHLGDLLPLQGWECRLDQPAEGAAPSSKPAASPKRKALAERP